MKPRELIKTHKTTAFLIIVIVGLLATLGSAATNNGRPINKIAIERDCDFITIGDSEMVVCQDGSEWVAEKIYKTSVPTPTQTITPTDIPIELSPTAMPEPISDDKPNVVEQMLASVAAQPVEASTGSPGKSISIRYSWYNPALGGTNCYTFSDGVCISSMSSGKPWLPYVGYAIACPIEWPFGTTIELDGKIWECLDRGSAIKYVNGIPWVDFLVETPAYEFGTVLAANIVYP